VNDGAFCRGDAEFQFFAGCFAGAKGLAGMSWWIIGLWIAFSATGLIGLLMAYRRPVYAPEEQDATRQSAPAHDSATGAAGRQRRRAVAA